MPETSLDPYYLLRWDFSSDLAVDRDLVQATHRLADLPFASDGGLSELLRRIPLTALSINVMGENPAYPTEWQSGLLGGVTAPEIIDLIVRGRIWVTLSQIDLHDEELAELVGRLTRELHECHVGLRVIEPHADLVLSSPTAQYYYGCDPLPSVLLHLRGRMRLRIYPNDERFIPQSDRQRIAYQQTHQWLYFEPSFDRQSRVFDVEPGQMISWPQHLPYRIENLEGQNLSLRLTFRTPRSIRQGNVQIFNRFLRSLMLDRFCDDRTEGFAASLKHAFAHFIRPPSEEAGQLVQPTFRLDESSPQGLRWLTEQADLGESVPAPGVATVNSGIFSAATTAVCLEN